MKEAKFLLWRDTLSEEQNFKLKPSSPRLTRPRNNADFQTNEPPSLREWRHLHDEVLWGPRRSRKEPSRRCWGSWNWRAIHIRERVVRRLSDEYQEHDNLGHSRHEQQHQAAWKAQVITWSSNIVWEGAASASEQTWMHLSRGPMPEKVSD